MITRIIKIFVFVVIGVSLWKITGGDLTGVLNGIWKILTGIVGQASDWLVSTGIFQSVLK